jgi:hypothetical protein
MKKTLLTDNEKKLVVALAVLRKHLKRGDIKILSEMTKIKYMTISRYLNGDIKYINLAISILEAAKELRTNQALAIENACK